MLGMVLIVFVYFLSLRLFVWCMPIWLGYVQCSTEGSEFFFQILGDNVKGVVLRRFTYTYNSILSMPALKYRLPQAL